ncbi:MAG TPA: DUF805 domain-containing protein [Thermomicrobiales bacterium]|nr:DUF805 domain-containing protein [Thermomicrobiales bacterium]
MRERDEGIMDVARLFSPSGRIGRQTFWFSVLIVLGLSIVVAILYSINKGVGIVAYLPLMWISLVTSVKRWHDRGKSGLWVLISLIPVVGSIWALVETGFLPGQLMNNAYGAPESGSPFEARNVARRPI